MARWHPVRAGIFNIWEYDDHVFEFGDGRLVLRGRNGSGKSNALTLLFPFLLDGVMSAWRMDPMGGARSMKSLLLGRDDDDRVGSYRHDSGTGYVWMEFADGDGYLTIGVGAAATVHRDADAWFFVTRQRIGHGLELAAADIPLTRRQLAERLEPGAVTTTAEEHRAAVDRSLFGLGPARYRTLIDLLITLRRPHLAGKLDTENLSHTLSAGLGELDPSLIDDVAHSFDDLDAMRHELEGLAASLDAVERFLPIYRDHLVGVARTRAELLIDATSTLAELAGQRAAADRERAGLADTIRSHEATLSALGSTLGDVDAQIETIRTSDAFRSAGALAEVRHTAESAATQAELDEKRVGVSQKATRAADDSLVSATTHRTSCEREVLSSVEEWSSHATVAGISPLPSTETFDADQVAAAVVQRRAVVDEVSAAALVAAGAADDVRRAERELARRRTDVDVAVTVQEDARSELDRRLGALEEDRTSWDHALSAVLAQLGLQIAAEVPTTLAPLWSTDDLSTPDDKVTDGGTVPTSQLDVFHRVDRALGEIDTNVALAVEGAQASVDAQQQVVADLVEERERVANEPNPGPPTNPTRPDAAQPDRAGAPLFVCVDFADSVDDHARAGLESALAGAGLLDARITPQGGWGDELDAHVATGQTSAAAHGSSLADVLVPVPVDGLDGDAIAAALRSVPLENGVVELHADGRWRLGPLAGRFEQGDARFIGHAARERRRTRRLADLDAQLIAERTVLDHLEAAHRGLVELRGTLQSLRAQQPSTAHVDSAQDDLRDAAARLAEARRVAEAAADALAEATSVAERLTSELHRRAVAANLPHEPSGLDAVRAALSRCERVQDLLVERRRQLARAIHAVEAAESAQRLAQERAESDAVAALASRERADRERTRYAELQASVGESAQDAERRLAAAEAEQRRVRSELAATRRAAEDAKRAADVLGERLAQLAERLRDAQTEADVATEHFDVVISAEVAEVLLLAELQVGVGAVGAAHAVMSGTEPVAVDATNRMERAHREILLDGLHAGHDPSMPKVDGIDVVRVGTAEGELPIGTLARQLSDEHERTSQLLTDKERSIFETHLLSRVGDALRQLLLDADAFEHRINAEMADAPTESGMVVELRWEVNGHETGLRDAVDLLRQAPEMLSTERRDELQQFFLSRIEELRSTEPGRSFAETLTVALDYRSWHRFALFARFADGKRQRVTKAFFKSLSGGEAASLLHLPLFASAAAQYSGGTVAGPRLIALDEAFVGIDDQMRSRLMGLLRQLDLDVILTSHEFWGFYDSVPSLVVYDLKRKPPIPGVYAQRFDWIAR